MKIETLEYIGEGYMHLIEYEGWRVAIANFCDRLLEKNLYKMERYLETDEVFILLEGEDMEKNTMEEGKIYNIKCGEWHCISMVPNTKVAIIENSGTGEKNTEHHYFREEI